MMVTQVSREVSTRLNQYYVIPMHNSTAEDGKQDQGHTTGLILHRTQDSDWTDLEITEIVAGTSNSNRSGPREEENTPDRFFNASDRPEVLEMYGQG